MISKLSLKYILIFILACLIIFLYIKMLKKPNVLKSVTNYRIYYRNIDDSILQGMSKYDLNIVEGSFFDKKDVSFLKENNSLVIGYYSILEIGNWDKTLIEKLKDTDYLKVDGNLVKNQSENNFLGDISQTNFQDSLISLIEERIISKGMDGVFFDTLDWIDYYKDNTDLYTKLIVGYREFLKKLKDKYPDLIIIQNRGFISYKEMSYKYIDAILWENFSSPYLLDNSEKIKELEDFVKFTRKKNTMVFTISFDSGKESKILSEKLNWIHIQSEMENRYSMWNINKTDKDDK